MMSSRVKGCSHEPPCFSNAECSALAPRVVGQYCMWPKRGLVVIVDPNHKGPPMFFGRRNA